LFLIAFLVFFSILYPEATSFLVWIAVALLVMGTTGAGDWGAGASEQVRYWWKIW
tara:strand:+ start:119 stop:283 length:165 start_codon:yes stop_codon:yes gene_type:complete